MLSKKIKICVGILSLISLITLISPRIYALVGRQSGGSPSSGSAHNLRQASGPAGSTLVGYWPFDGDSTDKSGHSYDATATSTTVVEGKFGKAYSFNGSSSFVDIADSGNLNFSATDSFSYFAWVKPADVGRGLILGDWSANGAKNTAMEFDDRPVPGQNSFRIYISDVSNNVKEYRLDRNYQVGIWYHLGFTYDNGTLKLYENGAEITPTVVQDDVLSGSLNNAGNFRMGKDNRATPGTTYFNGALDDVRMYSRTLSDAEASELFKGSNPPAVDQTVVGYWKMDDNAGNTTVTATVGTNGTASANTNTISSEGVYSSGFNFNGSTTSVDSGADFSWSRSGTFSIDAWIKPTAAQNSSIVGKGTAGNNDWEYNFWFDSNQTVGFYYWDTVANPTICLGSTATLALNQWHHVVITFDGTTAYVYADGVQVANQEPPAGTLQDRTGHTLIGSSYWNGGSYSKFAGNIDDVRIYNRALAPYEIYEQYLAGKSNHI